MSFFNSTVNLHHITPLPASISFDQALASVQNHDQLIRLDPEFVSYEEIPRDSVPKPYTAPLDSDTKRYKHTDHMNALPKGLWDSTVNFESEITNTPEGISWVVKAPLGLVQTTTWKVLKIADTQATAEQTNNVEGIEPGEWALVEDVKIEASRFLTGTVKGKCEGNWKNIHRRFVKKLLGQDDSTS